MEKLKEEFKKQTEEIKITQKLTSFKLLDDLKKQIDDLKNSQKDETDKLLSEIRRINIQKDELKNSINNIKKEQNFFLEKFQKEIIEKFEESEIKKYQSNFQQNDLNNIIKNIHKLLEEKNIQNFIEEKKNHKFLEEKNILKENQIYNHEIIKDKDNLKKNFDLQIKTFDNCNESKILKNDEILIIKDWVGGNFNLELLYSSQIHGKECKFFHSQCDGVGDCIVFIESENGRRFGGFTKLKWSSITGYMKGDGTDFIFSLTKRRKFKNNKNPEYAIYNCSTHFPTFGYQDIELREGCFENKYSTSRIKTSYGVGELLEEDEKIYLAGSEFFVVNKLEVFKVNKQ